VHQGPDVIAQSLLPHCVLCCAVLCYAVLCCAVCCLLLLTVYDTVCCAGLCAARVQCRRKFVQCKVHSVHCRWTLLLRVLLAETRLISFAGLHFKVLTAETA